MAAVDPPSIPASPSDLTPSFNAWFRDRIEVSQGDACPSAVLLTDCIDHSGRDLSPQVFARLMTAAVKGTSITGIVTADLVVWYNLRLKAGGAVPATRTHPSQAEDATHHVHRTYPVPSADVPVQAPPLAKVPTEPAKAPIVPAKAPIVPAAKGGARDDVPVKEENAVLNARSLKGVEYANALNCPNGMPDIPFRALKTMYTLEKASDGLLVQRGYMEYDVPEKSTHMFRRINELRPKTGAHREVTEAMPSGILPPPHEVWAAVPDQFKSPGVKIMNLSSSTWKTKLVSKKSVRGVVLLSGSLTVNVDGFAVTFVPQERSIEWEHRTYTVGQIRTGIVTDPASAQTKRKIDADEAAPVVAEAPAAPDAEAAAAPDAEAPAQLPVHDEYPTAVPAPPSDEGDRSTESHPAKVKKSCDEQMELAEFYAKLIEAKGLSSIEFSMTTGVVKIIR